MIFRGKNKKKVIEEATKHACDVLVAGNIVNASNTDNFYKYGINPLELSSQEIFKIFNEESILLIVRVHLVKDIDSPECGITFLDSETSQLFHLSLFEIKDEIENEIIKIDNEFVFVAWVNKI